MFQRSDSDSSFYLQSSWMLLATAVSHAFAFAVNFVAPWMSMAEYGLMATLLQAAGLMMIPAMGLQAVFAQEAASCFRPYETDELARTASTMLVLSGLLWLILAALAVPYRSDIARQLKIANPASFWVTLCLGLPQLWLPIMMGLLQGRQSFGWLGWALIANGVGRFCSVVVIVIVLGGQAAGAMTGILMGMSAAFAICAWQSRGVWFTRPAGFSWRPLLKRGLPLTLGLGSCQFMLSADMILARSRFEEYQTGLYSVAGIFARGVVILTGPIVAVMFPKVVNSLARSEPTNALNKALRAAAMVAGAAVLACTVGAWATPSLLRALLGPDSPLADAYQARLLMYRDSLLFIARLTPWFVWSMLPLAVANVLVAYVVARRFYWSVASLALVAVLYALALSVFSGTMIALVKMVGAFNLLFCVASTLAIRPKIPQHVHIGRILERIGKSLNIFRTGEVRSPSTVSSLPGRSILPFPDSSPPSQPCPICTITSASLYCRDFPGYVEGTRYDIYRCLACETNFVAACSAEARLYDSIYSMPSLVGYDRYRRYADRVLRERDPLGFLASQEAAYHILCQHLRDKSKIRVLDAGCGYGYLTYAMRCRGLEAFGFDVSGKALAVAREKYGDYFYHADLETFAAGSDQRFDLIVALELIEHHASPITCVEQLLRLLAPSGSLLVTTPNKDFSKRDAVWQTELPPVHTVWLGRKGLTILAERLGCEYRFISPTDFYPEHENKLAKYLGYRMDRRRISTLASDWRRPGGSQGAWTRLRHAANWVLHECGPVRLSSNIVHNCFVRVDETLAILVRKRGD